MKVLHIASHHTNVGDGALNGVIRRRLQAIVEEPIEFTLEDARARRDEILASDLDPFDLVVVGGGGAISINPLNALSGTTFRMRPEELATTRTPVAFVALGHNLFRGQRLPCAAQLRRLLDVCAERDIPFSVRNDGSLARLARDLGKTGPAVEVPDPGLFVDAAPRVPIEAGSDRFVIVQLAGDAPLNRLVDVDGLGGRVRARLRRDRRFEGARDAFVDEVTAAAMHAIRSWDCQVLLAPHIFRDADLVSRVLSAGHRVRPQPPGRPLRMLGTPHPRFAETYFGTYAAAQLVIGMRGHAVICGVGLRRPVIALSSHPKVSGFMESVGLASWSIDVTGRSGLGLVDHVDDILSGGHAPFDAERDRRLVSLSADLDEFLRGVVDRVRRSRSAT